ncbi:MAG: hypothetical protein IJ593_08160 [Lachnospiraceae bacterium]|nr:hypothetical protein [Lachnospiraceae bacterium]
MKICKKVLAMVLSITLVFYSTLPSLAQENNVQESIVDGKIVEQLKSDLGVEKAEEILAKSSLDDDLSLSDLDDAEFGELNETQVETTESLNESSQLEKIYDSNDELEDDLVQNEIEEEPEEDEPETKAEEEQENTISLLEIEEELEKDIDLTENEEEQEKEVVFVGEESEENADSTDSENVVENTNSSEVGEEN